MKTKNSKRRSGSPPEKGESQKSGGEKNGQEFRVLSYNIHQGKTAKRKKVSLSLLREAIKALSPDLVFLQEVAGLSHLGSEWGPDGDRAYQLEALADKIWPYHAFQKNCIFTNRYHGNAILSRFPIARKNLLDISLSALKRRGVLHAEIEVPGLNLPLQVLSTHLGLLQYERSRQVTKICSYVKKELPAGSSLLLAGDFNDWTEKISERLERSLKMDEAFLTQDQKHARTFPSRLPVLRLDRIYYRGFYLHRALCLKGRPWRFLSDHLPIFAHFRIHPS